MHIDSHRCASAKYGAWASLIRNTYTPPTPSKEYCWNIVWKRYKDISRMQDILLKYWMRRNVNTSGPPAPPSLLGIPMTGYIALSYYIIILHYPILHNPMFAISSPFLYLFISPAQKWYKKDVQGQDMLGQAFKFDSICFPGKSKISNYGEDLMWSIHQYF